MKARLLEYLICPACSGRLQEEIFLEDRSMPWTEIVEGCLTCEICGRQFPIREGVPRMLAGQLIQEVQETVEGFGFEWLTFDAQIQDTFMTDEVHFLDFIYPTTKDFFEGKLVLDAGCGMGRFLKLGAEFGSRDIIGVDLSESVNAAYQNTREMPNAHVVQADIMTLPFGRQFDYIFSVGVLHHMEDPREGFFKLVKLLREGGRISAWVYSKENNKWVIYLVSPVRRHITARLPRRVLYAMSYVLGLLLYACLQVVYRPANKSSLSQQLRLPNLLPYNDYLYYSSRLPYKSLVSVIFDHLAPQLSAYVSREEFESWFRDGKLESVQITSRNGMSWRGQGERC